MNTTHAILTVGFFLCFLSLAYSYGIYAGLIWWASARFGKTRVAPEMPEENLPRVTLFIAAYNEQAVIEQRILNALELDYPVDKFEIVIGSDGSSDQTAAIVRRFADRNVRLIDYGQRRGKASVINATLPELNSDIVVLSDANTFTERDALRKLVRWFADQSVGAVCGRLVLTDPATGGNIDSVYWHYETFLKKCEARLDALLGSNGAIYALRRLLFVPIPSNTIVDDFVIPLLAKLRWDCRIIYDAEAVAHEETAPDIAGEFRRRVRIGAGGFQAIGILWKLLNPRHGWITMAFFGHKVLRWFGPFAMLGMLLCNVLLATWWPWRLLLVCQALFYLAALAGIFARGDRRWIKALRVATMFAGMNLALLLGFWKWLTGPQSGAWRRTARPGEIPGAGRSKPLGTVTG